MVQSKAVLALDVGEKRIGQAIYDGSVRIARPLPTIDADGTEFDRIQESVGEYRVGRIVVGYPRGQAGQMTAQTAAVEAFATALGARVAIPVIFQDESLTSVAAEDALRRAGRPYTKGDIDAAAAALILSDYLESAGAR